MSPRTHRLMVAGIIAYGDGCSGASIINTKVSSYMDWIKDVTQSRHLLIMPWFASTIFFFFKLTVIFLGSICYSR